VADEKLIKYGIGLGLLGALAYLVMKSQAKPPACEEWCQLTIAVDPPECAGTHTTDPPPGIYQVCAGDTVRIIFGELPGDCMGYDIDYWEIITPEGTRTVSDYGVDVTVTGDTTVILHLQRWYE